jgi:hypothetical protein
MFDAAADGMAATDRFGAPEEWRFHWSRRYSRDEWLAQVPTFGGVSLLADEDRHRLLQEMGDAVDTLGGTVTMRYVAVVVTAVRA